MRSVASLGRVAHRTRAVHAFRSAQSAPRTVFAGSRHSIDEPTDAPGGAATRGIASGAVLSSRRGSRVAAAHANASAAARSRSETAVSPPTDADLPLSETVRDFLDPKWFYDYLQQAGFEFFAGVPDSLLKDFCAYLSDTCAPENHIITANEGSAVGIAAGYHLATRKIPVVYMQNSGFGNTVNPLLSLADAKVYNIPMLLMIGWRGEPGKKDEPQHRVQGQVMAAMLTDMGIPFEILPDYAEGAADTMERAVHSLESRGGPFALLVRRQAFVKYKMQTKTPKPHELTREEALRVIVENSGNWDAFVATTGFASRELYELREQLEQDHSREFLTVGSMGYASSIAYGIAAAKPSRNVICLDGDGACLMHMGTMATVGTRPLDNFKHVVINNGAHDSVGGQPTGAFEVPFADVAKTLGYKTTLVASSKEDIAQKYKELIAGPGPGLLEILCNRGARSDLGRPKSTPLQNKKTFMKFLEH